MSDASFKLSVLDITPVPTGSTPVDAIRNSVDLAQHADRLGYHRYWVAEHHNTTGEASSAPAVLVGQIAAATRSIRVGAGGVMLPNHSSLVVAEQFGVLEALHPGRIDLGIGRAPVDPLTAQALERPVGAQNGSLFPRQLSDLLGYFSAESGAEPVTAVPASAANHPPLWILGSSPSSAQLAAALGLPYAFANHLNGDACIPSMELYRQQFKPSAVLERPYAIVTAMMVAADTDAEAERLWGTLGLAAIKMRKGYLGPYSSPEEAAAYPYTPLEREFLASRLARHLVGGPEAVRRKTEDFVARTGADELMAFSLVHDHTARVRSHAVLAEAFGLAGAARPALSHAG
ncbi:LLM class flavin-dependent oxidoreductase [Kitasatospora sp. NPDC057692]|uniref:LLM class flavin-dependent oxidoreductase n=1 Tax=Kitasatospora sp. NPDC057692 TaxID=3346215 RepID=UPI0036CDADA9